MEVLSLIGTIKEANNILIAPKKPQPQGEKQWQITFIRSILTGGIARCKECGLAMNAAHSTKTKKGRLYAYNYYRCSTRNNHGVEACPNSKRLRAEDLEGLVWVYISHRLKDPEQLREDLEKMVELKREGVRGDPEREAKAWLDKLAETERKRGGFQDMAAEGLITFDELRSKLAELEELRKTAEGELKALESERERLERLEHDKEAVLKYYEEMAPEDLETRTPEERHRLYKMTRLEVLVPAEGPIEVSWACEIPTNPMPPVLRKQRVYRDLLPKVEEHSE